MPAPLRVALAAFGNAARVFHIPLIRSIPGLSLHAVVSSRPEAVRAAVPEVAVHTQYATVCADPDIDLIVIPTPNATHAPMAEAALRAGKHVVVDKPFTLDLAEAEALLALAAERGRVLSVFQNRRWDSDFLTLRAVLESGRVGRPVYLESHFDRFRPVVAGRWRDGDGPGTGLWYDLGSHLLDQALQLFGPPRAIWADLAVMRDGARAPDHIHAVLHYDRLRVVLHATTLAAAEPPRFVLHGTDGSFVIHGLDPQEDALKAGAVPGNPGWGMGGQDGVLTTTEGSVTVPSQPGDYRQFYLALREAMLGRGPNPVEAGEALAVMQALDLGRLSHAERREVPVEPIQTAATMPPRRSAARR
ncbi:MAG TPA: oxidoreductase [Acetobacteraceae bacterium]